MLKKFINIFFVASIFIFIALSLNFYFSKDNIKAVNKSRSMYSYKIGNNLQNLPLLKNDTHDIIEYSNDVEVYIKKKKNYSFWNLIGKE